jgi:hypothetical protein
VPKNCAGYDARDFPTLGGENRGCVARTSSHRSLVVSQVRLNSTPLTAQCQVMSSPKWQCLYTDFACSVICLDTVEPDTRVATLMCLHFFHDACFDQVCAAGITRCPMCKRSMFPSKVINSAALLGDSLRPMA